MASMTDPNGNRDRHFRPQGEPDHERARILDRLVGSIRQAIELPTILDLVAQEVRQFLGVDRVKIYRFSEDGCGQVLAEARLEHGPLPSLLGVWFPAEDVPASSRTAFVRDRQRVVVDVANRLTVVQASPPEGDPAARLVDSADARYQPVDPCHAAYLSGMGVAASITIPILGDGLLWGLLVAHHSQPYRPTESDLGIVQLAVDQLSLAVAQARLIERSRIQAHSEAITQQIGTLLHQAESLDGACPEILSTIVEALGCDGGRLFVVGELAGLDERVYSVGLPLQDTLGHLESNAHWQALTVPVRTHRAAGMSVGEEGEGGDRPRNGGSALAPAVGIEGRDRTGDGLSDAIFATDCIFREMRLRPLLNFFTGTSICGMAVVPLSYRRRCIGYLTLFRKEFAVETCWGDALGKGHYAAHQSLADPRNNLPGLSFAIWRKTHRGRSQPWQAEDLKLMRNLAVHLYLAIAQRRIERLLRHQACHDALTGLGNRLLFQEELLLALASCRQQGSSLAVLFLDIDGFKHVNDTLGHALGDRLLQQVARRLKATLQRRAVLARWGGDEFTLLQGPIAGVEEAAALAQEVLASLQVPFPIGGRPLYVKASIGVAIAPRDGDDADTLLKNADAALYRAKHDGRSRYQIYTPDIGLQVQNRLTLEHDLHRAIAQDELELYFQPQLDLMRGGVCGVEALLRWHHDSRGWISPAQFVPIATDAGLSVELGRWILDAACRYSRQWIMAGYPPMRISINLSPLEVQQTDLANQIADTLDRYDLSPTCLGIEITESTAMQDMTSTIAVLHALRAMGIRVAMDDFGTGYSSLWALKCLPLDTLKIDRSFILDGLRTPKDVAIVQATVEMARGMGLKTVAEGVETEEQLQFLERLHCDAIQGFWFSRPLPGPVLMERWHELNGLQRRSPVPPPPSPSAVPLPSGPGSIHGSSGTPATTASWD
ncbi:MAG: EAL domain-containing protein [Cyanobacteria bacterium]|nr:EAL domain-containing protein [Cyanobacteriota bacterium]